MKKIFVCGKCGKYYDNFDDWSKCCNRFIEEGCYREFLKSSKVKRQ